MPKKGVALTAEQKAKMAEGRKKASALRKEAFDLHNTVNVTLQKPRLLESEVIAYYKRLGARGRTPLWSTADFAEADMKARIQGLFAGSGITLVACMLLWYTTKSESLR